MLAWILGKTVCSLHLVKKNKIGAISLILWKQKPKFWRVWYAQYKVKSKSASWMPYCLFEYKEKGCYLSYSKTVTKGSLGSLTAKMTHLRAQLPAGKLTNILLTRVSAWTGRVEAEISTTFSSNSPFRKWSVRDMAHPVEHSVTKGIFPRNRNSGFRLIIKLQPVASMKQQVWVHPPNSGEHVERNEVLRRSSFL